VTRLAVLIVMIALLYQWWGVVGVVGVAYAELAAAVASMAVSLPTLFSSLRLSVREYLTALWRPFVGSALMGAMIVELVITPFESLEASSAFRELVIGTLLGAVAYPVCVGALWWLSGKPDSVEVMIVRRGLEALRARLGTAPP
jgi:hypothetical protein